MLDPLEFEKRPLLYRLHRMRRFAWLILTLEQLTLAFWQVMFWTMGFAALWLLRLPSFAGKAGDTIALFLFFGGLLYFLSRNLRTLRWPTTEAIDRHLERAGRIKNRPLAFMTDRLANPEREPTRHLWKSSRDQAFAAIRQLRIPAPRPLLSAADPYALRILVVLMLLAGMAVAGSSWKERLAYGLFPYSVHWQDKIADNVVVWIQPPAYTALPQTTWQPGSDKNPGNILMPKGSTIKARIRDGWGQPVLKMGATELKLNRLGDEKNSRVWGIETEAVATGTVEIEQLFLTRAKIPVTYVDDHAPAISLKGTVSTLPKGPLQIPLVVEDDYGVSDLTMTMNIDPAVKEPPEGQPFTETRAVMSPPRTAQEITPVYDLTSHPWAGLPVLINVTVNDHDKQTASLTPPIALTLPERVFYNPVAQKIISLRKRMIWTPEAAAKNLAYELEDILVRPGSYDYDIVVFLALRAASSRLVYAQTNAERSSVVPLLWDVALRVEEGDLTIASRELREARAELEKLLSDPAATPEQIAAATDKLQSAMTNYMQELYRELQKQMTAGQSPPQISPEQMGQALNMDDLASFMAQMNAEALKGDRNKARQMLSQLQNLMDRLDPSMSMEIPPEMLFMKDAIQQMKDLIEKQKALLGDTRTQAQKTEGQAYPEALPVEGTDNMPPPPQANRDIGAPQAVDTQAQKNEQENIRRALGELMLKADETLHQIPEKMQKAERAMNGASEQLGQNNPAQAVPHQEEALQNLQDGMEEMNKDMAEMMKQMTMMSFGMNGRTDPLGRPMQDGDGNSLLPGSQVKIPDQSERRRVQEILKELRQKSGEMHRPSYERDYFHRLMKQF